MKKFYYLSALAALATTSAFAQYTIPEENAALQGEDYHMQLYKAYDFATPAINGEAFDGSTIAWTGEETSDFRYNKYNSVRCSTEGLESFWYQIAAPTWYTGKGLKNTNSGPRGFAMGGMKAGQILVVQGYTGGYNTAGTSTFYNGYCVPNGTAYSSSTSWAWQLTDPLQVEDISEEVNTANGIVEGEDYEGSPYLYLRVLQDGWVSLTLERYGTICGVQVWNDAEAEETITDPSIKMASVYEDNRTWSWKPGESSLGSTVTTYYSFGENDPIYRDEDGKPVLTDGYYGENILEEGDEIESLAASDEDFGEGNTLKVNIASVSELGNASEIVTYEFDMNPIQLNAPTASLKGMDGKKRIYEVSWTNNTLCGEEYNLTYSTPSYEGDITLGENIEVEDAPVTINVEVDGYITGTLTIDELDVQGFEMKRKYELAEDAQHDWDFENLTTEQNQKIVGQYVIGEDPETEESIMLDAGWYYDSSRKRAFRNCNVVTTVIDAEFDENGSITNLGSVEIDGVKGVNRVSNESDSDLALLGNLDPDTHLLRETCDGFVEDKTGIFDGLTITGCAPYINSSSVWASDFGYYVENGATYSGFWPTSNATVTVNDLKAGDYVFYCLTGVVNAIEVPAGATSISFSVAKSAYLNYIDVFTCDDEAVGIQSAKAESIDGPADVYTIDGKKVKSGENIAKAIQGLKKGIYVVGGKKIVIK
jgi:hypothetical protein